MDESSPKKLIIPTFPPPPPPRKEISQLLPKSEQFRQERLLIKQERELAWKLRRVCHEFLEENDKDWAKRKVARIEEQKGI